MSRSVVALHLDPAAFWMLYGTYEGEPIVLDPWQIEFLADHSRYRALEKSPQIGFSWLTALEALWEAILFGGTMSSFVSVDQREAQNKVLYAKRAYYGLPEFVQEWVPMTRDAMEQIDLGREPLASSLMSIPATSALRGRKTNVYLDEVDFYKDAGESMFRIAMGRVTRGGHVTMGSTCFGVGTRLDKIMAGEERNFSRASLPWPVTTHQGSLDSIAIAKEELSEDDFLEEYCCVRGGGIGDSFPPALLRRQQHEDALVELEDLEPSDAQVIGYDVGTSIHPSVASVLERFPDGKWRQVCIEEMRGVGLPQQARFLSSLLARLPTAYLAVDAQGIGLHLTQQLRSEFRRRVIPIQPGSKPQGMPSQDRFEMAVELKRALEDDLLELAGDREQSTQFRRTRLLPGAKVDQPGSRKTSHYDRFWATGYAWYGTWATRRRSVYERRGLRVIGGSSELRTALRMEEEAKVGAAR